MLHGILSCVYFKNLLKSFIYTKNIIVLLMM